MKGVIKIKAKIAILMTCFNRCEKTIECLKSIKKNNNINYDVFLVNDGCTDNTVIRVKELFPETIIIEGTGDLFWNKGMHLAFKNAVNIGYEYYLWINDDVELYDNSIERLMNISNTVKDKMCIIVGYTLDKDRTTVSYGGQRISKGIIPLDIHMIQPTEHIEECDTMHGNCVLINCSVVDKIGIIDPFYTHGFGDVDYGLNARRNNIPIYLSNFPVGLCESNPNSNRSYVYKNKSLIQRFKTMNSWRHRPVKDWFYFTKKFGGRLWFIRFVGPYIKLIFNQYK